MENQPKKEEKQIKIPFLLQALLERRRYGSVVTPSLKHLEQKMEESEINAEADELRKDGVFY